MKPQQYFQSMAGRLFIVLMIGVVGSASLALGLADARRRSDLNQIRLDRIVERAYSFLTLADGGSESLKAEMLNNGVPGIWTKAPDNLALEDLTGQDVEFTRALAARTKLSVSVQRATPTSCIRRTPVTTFYNTFECWVVTAKLHDGQTVRMQMRGPKDEFSHISGMDPIFLAILALGVAGLAFFAARMAAAPLGELSRAAQSLGSNLDRQPMPEDGPHEVREAARAFNAMQAKLKAHVVERTHMLASITHDLQTPMTRLRLRLEKVPDDALRSRLIDDVGTMQALIREGLDFARSNQTNEPFAILGIDQMLEILVDDASDSGKAATLTQRCGYDVEARPRALQRCLSNLLDNALKYGGSAEVSAEWVNGEIFVRIRDHGPGIPNENLEAVLQPFVRLGATPSNGRDGVGLGLTIAKALAEKNDAELVLANHPEGGVEASIVLRRGVSATSAAPARRAASKASTPARPRRISKLVA